MQQDLQKLLLATHGLRDLSMGWPHREIASSNGPGLDSLLRELITYLQTRGALSHSDREVLLEAVPDLALPEQEPVDRKKMLQDLMDGGLTFNEVMSVFGEDRDSNPYAKAANDLYCKDGELEFGDKLVISESDDGGAYVMCWRWVDDADVEGQNGLKIGDEVWLTDSVGESGEDLSGVYRVYRTEPDEGDEVDEIQLQNEEGYVLASLKEVTKFDRADVAEWVGLHYKRNFDAESAEAKTDWIRRYIEARREG